VDFDRFKTNVLPPNTYVEKAKIRFDKGHESVNFPPYMAFYKSLRDESIDHQKILNGQLDVKALSLAFCGFPNLNKVAIIFTSEISVGFQHWRWELVTVETSHTHHISVLTDAIEKARNQRIFPQCIHLSCVDLRDYQQSELGQVALSRSLKRLLSSMPILRLSGSSFPMELICNTPLGIQHIDLCGLTLSRRCLEKLVHNNKNYIRSIGFHDCQVLGKLNGNLLLEMSVLPLCRMIYGEACLLKSKGTQCNCTASSQGWTIQIDRDAKSGSLGEDQLRKRKLNQI
jgi:hypothetical protein